jgi:hypothetical protein
MAQFARPISDLDNTGGWTTTPLWSKINEGGAGDGTVVISDSTPTTSEPFTVDLDTIGDPAVATGHILRIRWAKNAGGGGAKTIRIELREGYVSEASQGTLIATDDYSLNSTTLTTDTTTLSASEANSITDYSNLQIRIMGVASNRALKVDFAELETPDAAAQVIAVGTLTGPETLNPIAVVPTPIGTLAEADSLLPVNLPVSVGILAEIDTLLPIEIPGKFIYLRPIADDAAGSWTTTPLWSKVDEETPSDSDTILSDIVDSAGFSTTEAELQLTNTLPTTPSSVGAILGIRAKANLTGGANNPFMRVTIENRTGSTTVIAHTTNISTTFTTYYLPLSPRLLDANVVDWGDLRIILQGQIDGIFGTIQIEVSWVEIQAVNPNWAPPSFSDLTLPRYGHAGPIETGGFVWALGINDENELWLVKASNPSDGHNPGDWSFVTMVDRSKDSLNSAYMILDDGDLHIAIRNEVAGWFTTITPRYFVRLIRYNVGGSAIDLYGGIQSTTAESGQPEAVNADGRNGLWMGRRSDGTYQVATTYPEESRTFDIGKVWHFTSAGDDNSVTNLGTTGSHQLLATAVLSNNRIHMFMVHDSDDDGPNRQQTMRANDTVQTYPGSSWSAVDLVGWGAGIEYGTNQILAAFRRSTTGIRAALFTSADSPSPSEEIVTTRDAHGVGYRTSIAVLAPGSTPWVFWLDDAATDAIYSASRPNTSWIGEVQRQAGGGHSWNILYGGVVNGTDAGILVSSDAGTIFYYEFALDQVIAIGTLAESETLVAAEVVQPAATDIGTISEANVLKQIISDIPQIVPVTTLPETDSLIIIQSLRTFDVGTLVETDSLAAITLTLDGRTDIVLVVALTDAASLGQVLAAKGLGQPRTGDHIQKIYHPDRRIIRR